MIIFSNFLFFFLLHKSKVDSCLHISAYLKKEVSPRMGNLATGLVTNAGAIRAVARVPSATATHAGVSTKRNPWSASGENRKIKIRIL